MVWNLSHGTLIGCHQPAAFDRVLGSGSDKSLTNRGMLGDNVVYKESLWNAALPMM